MKGGPSIAVMLAGKPHAEDAGEGEGGLGEAKASAMDASKALMHAVRAGDAEGVYRAFRSLCALCKQVDDLEDSGEGEDEGGDEKEEAEGKDEAY